MGRAVIGSAEGNAYVGWVPEMGGSDITVKPEYAE